MMAGSGHIAGVINAPDAQEVPALDQRRPCRTASRHGSAGATEHPGSWWPDWAAWLAERSGGKVPARDPSKGPLQPLEDAPGSYVKVKS